MDEVRQILEDMPDSVPPPPLDSLLLVGFATGKTWTLRIYDRSSLPPQVERLLQCLRYEVPDRP